MFEIMEGFEGLTGEVEASKEKRQMENKAGLKFLD
jgi:hypothetical protein